MRAPKGAPAPAASRGAKRVSAQRGRTGARVQRAPAPPGRPPNGANIVAKTGDPGGPKVRGPTTKMRPVDARRWLPQNSRQPPESSRHATCQSPTKSGATGVSSRRCATNAGDRTYPDVKEGHRNKIQEPRKGKGTPERTSGQCRRKISRPRSGCGGDPCGVTSRPPDRGSSRPAYGRLLTRPGWNQNENAANAGRDFRQGPEPGDPNAGPESKGRRRKGGARKVGTT